MELVEHMLLRLLRIFEQDLYPRTSLYKHTLTTFKYGYRFFFCKSNLGFVTISNLEFLFRQSSFVSRVCQNYCELAFKVTLLPEKEVFWKIQYCRCIVHYVLLVAAFKVIIKFNLSPLCSAITLLILVLLCWSLTDFSTSLSSAEASTFRQKLFVI